MKDKIGMTDRMRLMQEVASKYRIVSDGLHFRVERLTKRRFSSKYCWLPLDTIWGIRGLSGFDIATSAEAILCKMQCVNEETAKLWGFHPVESVT